MNCGQVRGPVQINFSRSIDPIVQQEVTITRQTVTREEEADKERTMGRKHIVPYGLYRVEGYISAKLANDPTKGTGFSKEDMELFWEALKNMFEHDRSAARGKMATRRLFVFKHESDLGNAPAQFQRLRCDSRQKRRAPGRHSGRKAVMSLRAKAASTAWRAAKQSPSPRGLLRPVPQASHTCTARKYRCDIKTR